MWTKLWRRGENIYLLFAKPSGTSNSWRSRFVYVPEMTGNILQMESYWQLIDYEAYNIKTRRNSWFYIQSSCNTFSRAEICSEDSIKKDNHIELHGLRLLLQKQRQL